MDQPPVTLDALAGTSFGPVAFDDDGAGATFDGRAVELAVDGPTYVASAPVVGREVAEVRRALADSDELLELDGSVDPPVLRCWARSAAPGDVAVAVRAVARLGGASDAVGGTGRGHDPSPPVDVADVAEVADAAVAVLDELAASGSPALAADLEALVRGQREQVLLDRVQLDELVGTVLGGVTVFGIGAGGGGGVTVNLGLPSGRVVDLEVEVGATGTRLEPLSEAAEVAAVLAAVRELLAGEGRRLARVAAAGDGIVVATEPV